MYIPKGTTISYRTVMVKCEDVEKEMILVDKDIFESIVTMLGFEKREQGQEEKQEQGQEEKQEQGQEEKQEQGQEEKQEQGQE